MTALIRTKARDFDPVLAFRLEKDGVGHPLLAQLFTARGIKNFAQANLKLEAMIPPQSLENAQMAADILAYAVQNQRRVLIVGDYDCDGATSTALAVRAFAALGLKVDYFIPDRFKLGYGMSRALIDAVLAQFSPKPEIIVTVDNGMASLEGVEYAKRFGIATIITDHHLPAERDPEAACIVNPNQRGSRFPSKNLAGVGVIFYVMLALRAELEKRGYFENHPKPNFGALLPLVALGTVADLVTLDQNNRILVKDGLRRINVGDLESSDHARLLGLQKLFEVAGVATHSARVEDLGFRIAPRLNAAGRMESMDIGVKLLLTNDIVEATQLAYELSNLNHKRQSIQNEMKADAEAELATLPDFNDHSAPAICLYNPSWHEGVVGLIASHLVKTYHLPAFVFGKSQEEGLIKGSGRSVPALHLRDTLDEIAKLSPGILKRFGGHAMAAGLTLAEENFEDFKTLLTKTVAQKKLPNTKLIETDGALPPAYFNEPIAKMLQSQIWGQGFPEPLFEGVFYVKHQQVLKEKHLKMLVTPADPAEQGKEYSAIFFSAPILTAPQKIKMLYRSTLNTFRGRESLSLIVEHLEDFEKNNALTVENAEKTEFVEIVEKTESAEITEKAEAFSLN